MTNSRVNAAPGREPWVALFDIRSAAHIGPQALSLRHSVDNEALSIADGPGWRVLFDGRLYNAPELRSQLLADENIASDAYLIGLAHRRWGDDFFNRIEGIYSFLILDMPRNKLLAARDRLGFQPLFYAPIGEMFLFSDSIIDLKHDPQLSCSLNRPALADYLAHRYPDVSETFFTEIRRLPPSGKMDIDLVSGKQSLSNYWEPSPPGTPDDSMSEEDLDQFDLLLQQAVRRSLTFGKPGIFLSGGLDSVSVGAAAVNLSEREGWPKPWALSVGFPDSESNEQSVQRGAASGLGIPQIMLPFSEGAGSEGLFESNMMLNRTLAAPIDNPWRSVYMRLMQQAKEKDVDVIVTGSGGDDWLTVNPDYMADLLGRLDLLTSYRFARSQIDSYRGPRLAMIRSIYWNFGMRPLLTRQIRLMGRKWAPGKLHDLRYRKLLGAKQTADWIAEDPQLRQELDRRTKESIEHLMARPEPEGPYGFYNYFAASLTFNHPLNSLSQEEDFAVGRQLGMRLLHPYWDSQLIRFLCRVPPRLLLRGGREKGLVRQSVARRLPDLGFESQKKVRAGDFFMSIVQKEGPAAWKRIGGAKALSDLGIVKSDSIEGIMRESYPSDEIYNSFRVWEVLNLESWVRAHR